MLEILNCYLTSTYYTRNTTSMAILWTTICSSANLQKNNAVAIAELEVVSNAVEDI